MNSPVDKIKERLGIEEVISSYLKLDRAGNNLKARCPFHNEKTPSFFVSPDRGSYYCFGCGASGDIFTFVEQFEGLDFKGALKLLADRAGVELQAFSKETKENKSEKEKLYEVMEEATKYFENNLVGNQEVLDYLKARGLNEKSIKEFRIGFAKLDWRELYFYLQKKNFSDEAIEKAGLAKKSEKGFYDRFRGRIMFPINDSSGRVVAFSGRIFDSVPTPGGVGKPTPQNAIVGSKYLNSPETPIFSKHAVLYGIDKAKDAIRKNNFSILVEGQMDLILSQQAGYRNTVATSGTALSDATLSKENVVSNLGLVRRLSSNIVLAFDADKAGANATIRAGKIALSLGMDVKVVDLPEEVDPADLISGNGLPAGRQGTDLWRDAIKNSKHIIEFLLNKVLKNYENDPRKAGKEVKEKVLPFINALESSIEKTFFIKKISTALGVSETVLQEDLGKIEEDNRQEEKELHNVTTALETKNRRDYIKRRLLGIALWQKSLGVKSPPNSIDFNKIFEILGEVPHKYESSKEDLIFEAEVLYENNEDLEKSVNEMISSLEEENINEELEKKMFDLSHADKEASIKILKEINELNKKRENIKSNRLNK